MLQQAEPLPESTAEITIPVTVLRVNGNTVFPASELEALVTDLGGGERSLAELNAGADRITAYYRSRGFLLARAYLPAQEIREGVVFIAVTEGRLGSVQFNNMSRLNDRSTQRFLGNLDNNAVLQQAPLEKMLSLLNEMPGVGAAGATFQPGASVGTSDLIVSLAPAAPYALRLETDSFGNRYTGEYRIGAALDMNSPFHAGDQFSLRALATGHLHYVRAAFQAPFGGSGLRLGAAYSDTAYGLTNEFSALQAEGTAGNASVFMLYPLVRGLDSSITGSLSLEKKELDDKTGVPATASDRQVLLANASLSGIWSDFEEAASTTSMAVALISGQVDMDDASLALDATTTKSEGSFNRLTWAFRHQRQLGGNSVLSLSASGQLADKNLNSSEKFLLGGAYGVRAYPPGEGNGDIGWLLNLELRHRFMPELEGILFYDIGQVDVNRSPFAPGNNSRKIAGAGLGVNAVLDGLQLNAWLAWRVMGGASLTDPAAVSHPQRFWFQALRQF